MKKGKQRKAALFLVICMVLSMFNGIPVYAAGGDEDGHGLKIAWARCEWDNDAKKDIYDHDEEWYEDYASWPGNYLLYIADTDENPIDSISITPEDGVEVEETEETGYFNVTFYQAGEYTITSGDYSAEWRVDWPKFALYDDEDGNEYKMDVEYTKEDGASFYIVARADDEGDDQGSDDTQCTITVDSNVADYITIEDEEWQTDGEEGTSSIVMAANEEPKEVTIAPDVEGEFDINLSWPVDWDPGYDNLSIHCYEKRAGLVAAWAEIDQENGQYGHEPYFWKSTDGCWMGNYCSFYLEYWDGEGDETPVDEVLVQYNGGESETVEAVESGYFLFEFNKLGKYTVTYNNSMVTIVTRRPDIAFYRDAEATNRIEGEITYQRGTETTFYVALYEEIGGEVSYNVSPQEYVTVTVDGKEVGDEPIVNETAKVTISAEAQGDFELNVEGMVEIYDEGNPDELIDSWGVGDNIWINEARTGLVIKDWIIWGQEDVEWAEQEGVEFPGDFVFPDVCPGSGITKSIDWAEVNSECILYLGYVAEEGEEPTTVSVDKLSIWRDGQRVDQGENAIAQCYPNEQNEELINFLFYETGEYTITYSNGDISSSVWIQVNARNINFYSDAGAEELITEAQFTRGTSKTIYLIPADEDATITYNFVSYGSDGKIDLTVEGENLTYNGAEANITTSGIVSIVINEGAKGYFDLGVEATVENEDGEEEWYGNAWLGIADTYVSISGGEGAETGFSGTFISKGAYDDEYPFWCEDSYWVHGETAQKVIEYLIERVGENGIEVTNDEGVTHIVRNTGYILLNGSAYDFYKDNANEPQTITIPSDSDIKGIRIGDSSESYYVVDEDGNHYQVSKWVKDGDEKYTVDTNWDEDGNVTEYCEVEACESSEENPTGWKLTETTLTPEELAEYVWDEDYRAYFAIPQLHVNANSTTNIRLAGDFLEGEEGSSDVYLRIADQADVTLGVVQYEQQSDEEGNEWKEYAGVESQTFIGAEIISETEEEISGVKINVRPLVAISTDSKVTKSADSDFAKMEDGSIAIDSEESTNGLQSIRDQIKDSLPKGEDGEIEEAEIEVSLDVDILGNEEQALGGAETDTKKKTGIGSILDKLKKALKNAVEQFVEAVKEIEFFDITLQYQVVGDNGETEGEPTALEEIDEEIAISMELPDKYQPEGKEPNAYGKPYEPVVYRYHEKDGLTDKIKSTYDKENHKLTLYTNKFSVYAVALEAAVPTGIEITKQPTTTTYEVGKPFNSAGMEVNLVFSDGDTEPVSNFKVDTTTPLKATDTKVTVTYTDQLGVTYEAEVAIKVTDSGAGTGSGTVTDPGNVTDPGTGTTQTPADTTKAGDKATVDGNTYTVTDVTEGKKSVEYTSGDKNASKVTIPATVNINGTPYTVTAIADNAFKGNTKLTTVTIPATVTKIGKNAFKGCTKLKKVTIPKNVTEIGANAFSGCKKLGKVTFKGTKLTKIGQGAFQKCVALKSVTIPKSVKEIGKNAFNGCTKLNKVTFKGTVVKKIGKNAFKNIAKKATIKVPKKKKAAYQTLLKKSGYKGTVK